MLPKMGRLVRIITTTTGGAAPDSYWVGDPSQTTARAYHYKVGAPVKQGKTYFAYLTLNGTFKVISEWNEPRAKIWYLVTNETEKVALVVDTKGCVEGLYHW
jgi:hypothetical protein